MTNTSTEVKDFNEIDIYGSQEYYDMVMEVLFHYSENHLSLHKSYRNALELVRRAVWRNYGEATYLKYEDEIRHALYGEVLEYTELSAVENLKHHFEYDCSIREFYEQEMAAFEALDCLYENCVKERVKGADNGEIIH